MEILLILADALFSSKKPVKYDIISDFFIIRRNIDVENLQYSCNTR